MSGGGDYGQSDSGILAAIEAITAALAAPAADYFIEVARGNVSGQSIINKFGRNPDIDNAGGFEAIWNGGGAYTGHNAVVAETVEIFSGNSVDNAGGTGAQSVRVWGLDANYAQQTEDVTLHATDGTIAVDTANTYIRLDRCKVLTAGSGGANAGALTARQKTTTANIFMVLPIGYNQTMIAAYTIPAGKTGYLLAWFAATSGKTNADANVRIRMREFGEVFAVKEELTIKAAGSSYTQRHYDVPKNSLSEKTDVFIEADANANDSGISAGFDILLVDN